VFFLGSRHFGVITAYVAGADAAQYHFTSAVPVQVLKSLRPVLEPLLFADAAEKNPSASNNDHALTAFCCRRDAKELEAPTVWWQDLLPVATQ
ncbi:MAG: hypothetical protein QX198_01890, partial [Methylococcaceae bacterium]